MDPAIKADIDSNTKKRRTFAIISHPDAGKTTLTEKLLLFSGMIRTAGVVGSRKSNQGAASDWMGMEQERGISITASAMQFPYKGLTINVLDTPGHQDFCEDTYRTITAADSVIMVIDSAKGVETQTRKLFETCKLRKIPVITFINKMDRYGKDPIELMEEVEEVLGIEAAAINWPVGRGQDFRGVVNLASQTVDLYTKTAAEGSAKPDLEQLDLNSAPPTGSLSADDLAELRDEVELVSEAGNEYTHQRFLEGQVTPVYFGSALTNFGVEPLFDAFVDIAPCPHGRVANISEEEEILVDPVEEPFSAYIFKLQANMNPRHRDCIAFMRINTGRFEKDLVVTNQRSGKKVRLAQPHSLMAEGRETLVSAYPGDVIGVISSGNFQIGDTITSKNSFSYKPLPYFQPEHFARLEPAEFGKRKSIDKGLAQLVAEGTVQIMRDWEDHNANAFIGAVGQLQFEVLRYRLEDEYKVKTRLTPLGFDCSCWLMGDVESFKLPFGAKVVKDQRDMPMVLFKNQWDKGYAERENPDHQLVDYA